MTDQIDYRCQACHDRDSTDVVWFDIGEWCSQLMDELEDPLDRTLHLYVCGRHGHVIRANRRAAGGGPLPAVGGEQQGDRRVVAASVGRRAPLHPGRKLLREPAVIVGDGELAEIACE